MGTVLFFTTGCSNDDDDADLPDAEVSYFSLVTSNNITEHSVGKTGDVLLTFKGEVRKPGTVKVYRTHTETGEEDIVVDTEVNGTFSIIKDVIYMEPGQYTLYGEITIGEKTYRTDQDLTVTVTDEKIDVGDNFTIGLEDATKENDELLVGRRYGLEINWWLGPGEVPTNNRVEWESDNEAVATVEVEPGAYNDGWVYIHSEGSFRLTATSKEKPHLSFGKDFTAVENISDDRPVITVNSTSSIAQEIQEVTYSAVDVRFTIESEQDDPDPEDEHQWFAVNFAYDADGIPADIDIEYQVPTANIDWGVMKSTSEGEAYWLQAGNHTLRLKANFSTDEITVPVRVWVSDAQVTQP